MKILNEPQIKQKIKRLAFEILENNFNEKELFLAGINKNGLHFAKLIKDELSSISEIELHILQLKLNPAHPLKHDITLSIDINLLENKVIIIVDDVANTGRTIFYAIKPLLDILPKRVEVAVLVDRKHKSFPILTDYVGLSLATTLKEDIEVKIRDVEHMEVFLD